MMGQYDPDELARATNLGVTHDAPLAPFTSLKVGGPAKLLIRASLPGELAACLGWAAASQVPVLVLGGGSNVVVADRGFPGLAIKVQASRQEIGAGTITDDHGTTVLVDVEAGCMTASVSRWAAREGLGGVEWACGIPGTIGGAVAGNAGAYDGDIASIADAVRAWVPGPTASTGSVVVFANAEMGFDYRRSRFKDPGHGVVLGVRLRLKRADPERLLARIDELERTRRRRQPTERSCGSVFRNPPGDSAGRLLEAAGMKGHLRGDAQVSPVHANWIVNRGRATATDVAALMREGQATVFARDGIRLQPEVLLVGDWDPRDTEGLLREAAVAPAHQFASQEPGQ